MKNFIAAALVALSLAFGVARSPAKMACENPMPIEAKGDAKAKLFETLTTGGEPSLEAAPQRSPLKLPLVNPRVVVSKSKR
ncbi:MAG TPA: hypothetical protein VGA87_00570, partial [Pyrinomonadaceae bacterium]